MLFPRNVNLNYCNIVRLRVLSLTIWALSTALSLGFLAFFHPPFITIIVCILVKRRSIMLMILRIMNFWLRRRRNICWMNWMTNTIEIGGSIKIYGLFFSKWASLIIRRKIKLSLYGLHFLLRKYLLKTLHAKRRVMVSNSSFVSSRTFHHWGIMHAIVIDCKVLYERGGVLKMASIYVCLYILLSVFNERVAWAWYFHWWPAMGASI